VADRRGGVRSAGSPGNPAAGSWLTTSLPSTRAAARARAW
jgi:hypothetical protein